MGEAQKPTMSLEERLDRMCHVAQKLTVLFAVVLLFTGGLLSVKADWARGYDPKNIVIPASDTQFYATAVVNLLSGILYAITAIGLLAATQWSVRLNIISCAVYVVGTLVVEMIELDKGNVMESFADVTFWSALPIIQLTLMLVARAQKAKGPLQKEKEAAGSETS